MMVIMINVSRNAGVNYMKPRLTVMMMCCYTMRFYELETHSLFPACEPGGLFGAGLFLLLGSEDEHQLDSSITTTKV